MKLVHSQLKVIPKPKGEVLYCRFCKVSRFKEVVIRPVLEDGKISGGLRELVCDVCGRPVIGS